MDNKNDKTFQKDVKPLEFFNSIFDFELTSLKSVQFSPLWQEEFTNCQMTNQTEISMSIYNLSPSLIGKWAQMIPNIYCTYKL